MLKHMPECNHKNQNCIIRRVRGKGSFVGYNLTLCTNHQVILSMRKAIAKSKHTPGPWECDTSDTQSTDVTIVGRTKSSNPRYVARVHGEGVLSRLTEERNANARLIAASPETTQSCRELLGLVQVLRGNRKLSDSQGAILIRANATIAKAAV